MRQSEHAQRVDQKRIADFRQLHMVQQRPMEKHVVFDAIRPLRHVSGLVVVALVQAIPHDRHRIGKSRQIRVVPANDRFLFDLIHKGLERVDIVLHVFIIVNMVDFHIRDNRVIRMVRQKVTLEFARFQNKVFRVFRHVAVPVSDKETGLFKTGKHRRENARRCRLAMRSRHANRRVALQQMAQVFVVVVRFDTRIVQRRFHFRVPAVKR